MINFFDRNETRPLKSREVAMFRDFKAILSYTRPHASMLRGQTRDIDIARIKRREDLARIPVVRRAQIAQIAADAPPYGGMLATRPGNMRHLLPQTAAGHAPDWWNAARAMYAAGFAKGDVILNCASYHMANGGHLVDGGARELGCSVIPAGSSHIERQLAAIRQFSPTAFCGKPAVLARILDAAADTNTNVSTIAKALVFGAPLSPRFRAEAQAHNILLRQAYSTAEAGVIAYETSGPDGKVVDGMMVNEGVIVEIVTPGGDEPVAEGEIGEVVVTRLNTDLPLLRFGTGDLSRFISGPSPCGRTNLRIQGWLGRVEDVALLGECRLQPAQVLEVAARHACVDRMRLVLRGNDARCETVLRAETANDDPQLPGNLKKTAQTVLGFEPAIEIVARGALPDDGRLIVDERAR